MGNRLRVAEGFANEEARGNYHVEKLELCLANHPDGPYCVFNCVATRFRFKNGIVWRPVALEQYTTASTPTTTVTTTIIPLIMGIEWGTNWGRFLYPWGTRGTISRFRQVFMS